MNKAQKLILWAAILGSGIAFLDGIVVNIALPKIATDLHASYSGLQWIADAYLITLSSLIIIGGSMGDIYGRKRIFQVGLIGFGATSLLCGLAFDTVSLILFRGLQGIFGALLVPSSLAILETSFPAGLREIAISRWTAYSSAFAAIGPFVGGYLLDVASWRWIFFINVPLIIAAVTLAWLGLREHAQQKTPRRLDRLGALFIMITLGGLTYALIEGPSGHWSTASQAALVAGLLACGLFLYHEHHYSEPMVKLGLFKSRNFSGANLATFGLYGALSGMMFALVIYLQTALGYSALAAGISLLPVTILLILLSGRVGALTTKYGARIFMTLGPILAGIGMFLLSNLHHENNYLVNVFPGVLIFSLGLAITVAPLTTTVMSAVDTAHSGIASGVNNAVSRIAGLLVVAAFGLLAGNQASNAAAAQNTLYSAEMLFCAALALLAGIISWLTIRKQNAAI